jgi:hypothetical protein
MCRMQSELHIKLTPKKQIKTNRVQHITFINERILPVK